MNVGSLFSGIGGLDLGLERAGMTVRWQSEIDPYACRVLAKHWPHVPNLGDVTTIDWSTVERVDLVCGGFPCPDISQAGRRRGIEGPRSILWREFRRCLRDLRPRLALVENVGDLAVRGLDVVVGELAALGYDAEWQCIPAASVGAPHLRERLFIVAYPDGTSRGRTWPAQPRACATASVVRAEESRRRRGALPNPDRERLEGRRVPEGEQRPAQPHVDGRSPRVFRGPLQPGGEWSAEPGVGRVADGVPDRLDRLRCLGNAVVPQVAEHIGRLILAAERVTA